MQIDWLTFQYIIESVVKELAKDPTKKFIQVKRPNTSRAVPQATPQSIVVVIIRLILVSSGGGHQNKQKFNFHHHYHDQVETGFFWRWWEEKDDWMRNLTRTLVEVETAFL